MSIRRKLAMALWRYIVRTSPDVAAVLPMGALFGKAVKEDASQILVHLGEYGEMALDRRLRPQEAVAAHLDFEAEVPPGAGFIVLERSPLSGLFRADAADVTELFDDGSGAPGATRILIAWVGNRTQLPQQFPAQNGRGVQSCRFPGLVDMAPFDTCQPGVAITFWATNDRERPVRLRIRLRGKAVLSPGDTELAAR